MYFEDFVGKHWTERSAIPMGKHFFEMTQRYNGRTRPGISSRRLRSGIRRFPFTEPLHQIGSSLGDFRRGVSSSLPCTRLR